MSALELAWRDDDFGEPYADLDPTDRALRDAAQAEVATDELAAILGVELADAEDLRDLLSWLDDPAIWGPPPPRRRYR